MKTRYWTLVAVLGVGCTPVSMIDRRIEVSAGQFQDIPVPAGFRLVDRHHESHSLALGPYRFGTYRYVGSTSVPSSVSYVLERMPQHAWSLVDRSGQGTDAERLVFEREGYRSEYRVFRQDSSTQIEVDLRTHANSIAKS
ncbi:MAG: hypothetical protein R3F56_22155 [Planctomycetota bacterium]